MTTDAANLALVIRALATGPMRLGVISHTAFPRYSPTDACRCVQTSISVLVSRGLVSGPDHAGCYSLTDAGRQQFGPHLDHAPADQCHDHQGDLFAAAPESAPQPVCNPPAAPPQPTIALPNEFAKIWQVLKTHRGASAAITAPAIAAAAGLWTDIPKDQAGTQVRKILELTQDAWPWPIVGDSRGYYLAATADELSHYDANLTSRLAGLFRRRRSHRRTASRCGFEHLGHGNFAQTRTRPQT